MANCVTGTPGRPGRDPLPPSASERSPQDPQGREGDAGDKIEARAGLLPDGAGLGSPGPEILRSSRSAGRVTIDLLFFVFLITPLPPWDPPDAWRGPHPKQILYSRTELSASGGAIPPRPRVLRSLDFQEAQRHLVGAWAPQKNYRETLPLLERDAALIPSFPGLSPFFPPPGHSLGFPATSAWSQGPPCAQGNVSSFPRRLRLRLPVQLLTLRRVSISVFGGLLRQSTHRRRLPVKGGASNPPTPNKDASKSRI
eukprot:bmy_15599T0